MLVACCPLNRCQRGDTDKRAAGVTIFGALDHMCGCRAQGEKYTIQIDRQHITIGLRVHFSKITGQLADTGIGNHRINPPESGQRFGKGRIDRCLVSDIDCPGLRFYAKRRYRRNGVFVLFLIGSPNSNIGTGLRHCLGHAKPDAAITARHQSYFSA